MPDMREHHAVEIVPGLILGGLRDLPDILAMQPDVLVPLDSLPGDVWDTGFRGEILYYPIRDYGLLPNDVLEELADKVLARIRCGKRVAIFCSGGHGRTGYAAACVLFRLGHENPIAFLHQHYDPAAVETEEQENAVERYCFRYVAVTFWNCKQLIRTVRVHDVSALDRDPDVLTEFARIRNELGPKARILLRKSGVLPEIRVLVEAPEEAQCEKAMDRFLRVLTEKGYLAEMP